MEKRIWTLQYYPFVMGDVWQPVATYVPIQGEFDLGKGFRGYLIVAPNGKTFVAETETGAIVGPTIEQVRIDIAECKDKSVMDKQVKDAKKHGDIDVIDSREFWRLLKCAA